VNNQQNPPAFLGWARSDARDDISTLKGNHLFQFGGTYQHNWDYHQRNDSGGTINAFPVYSLGNGLSGSGVGLRRLSLRNDCYRLREIDGVRFPLRERAGGRFHRSQMFSRSGASLTLDPPLSNAFDKSTIPYYTFYFSDTWHMKPSFTLTYGLGWALEMPPVEENGKQTVLVDAANQPVTTLGYLANVKNAALQGNVYIPNSGLPWWAIPRMD